MSRLTAIFVWGISFLVALAILVVIGKNLFLADKPVMTSKPAEGTSEGCPLATLYANTPQPRTSMQDIAVYSHGPNGDIRMLLSSALDEPCAIEILAGPKDVTQGADWRMGFALPEPERFRGQLITAVVDLVADTDIEVESATFYLHDRSSVSGVPVPDLVKNEEIRVETTHRVAPDATIVELWLRLVPPGGGSLGSGKITLKRLEFRAPDTIIEP